MWSVAFCWKIKKARILDTRWQNLALRTAVASHRRTVFCSAGPTRPATRIPRRRDSRSRRGTAPTDTDWKQWMGSWVQVWLVLVHLLLINMKGRKINKRPPTLLLRAPSVDCLADSSLHWRADARLGTIRAPDGSHSRRRPASAKKKRWKLRSQFSQNQNLKLQDKIRWKSNF